MNVFPTNNSGLVVGWLAGRFPGRIGHLYSPGGWRRPYSFIPYALDNGKFPVWAAGKTWNEISFLRMLEQTKHCGQAPIWLLVPDVVADRDGTLREWDRWSERLQGYGWPLAFAAQDGMVPEDVPEDAEVVFLGGTTEWKQANLQLWCGVFPRVHVGRVNGQKLLWECHNAGAESCDGTGWMRGDQKQLAGLITYLEQSSLLVGAK